MKTKQSKYKRILFLFLVLLSLGQIVGCSNQQTPEKVLQNGVKIEAMEAEKADNFSFDFIGGTDVMPIVGYYGPRPEAESYNGNRTPDYYSDEIFQLIKATGVNVISYNVTEYGPHSDLVFRLLEQGEKYGIGITVTDPRISFGAVKEDTPLELVDQYVNEYSNYPAYVANFIQDEPFYAKGAEVGGVVGYVSDFAPAFQKLGKLGLYGYGNLLPYGVSDEIYSAYLKEAVTTWETPYLSYDYYPYTTTKRGFTNAGEFFKNLKFVREAAEEANIPFWSFIQAGAQWADEGERFDSEGYFPSQGEFFWSVGASLAFGAKGIQYFPLIQPIHFSYAKSEPYDFQRNGLIGAYGNKTRWFYYAQDMSAQIAAVDEVLMNSVNKGVLAYGKQAKSDLQDSPYLIKGDGWRELVNVDGDAIVGCFNYNGKTALYVVCNDMEYAQEITLQFADNYNVTVTQDAEMKHLSGDSLKLILSAGNSALVVFD